MSPRFEVLCAVVFVCPLVSAADYGNDCIDETSLIQIKKTVAFGSERFESEPFSRQDVPEPIGSGHRTSNQYAYLSMPTARTAGGPPETPHMITPQMPPQMQPGLMAINPTSFTGGSAEQEQLMQMAYDKQSGEQAYLAQQKQAEADYLAQERARAKTMMEQLTKQKAADLVASQVAQATALHQAQQQEEMGNAQAMAEWQKKEGENAKMLGLGPMLSMTVRAPTTAYGAAPKMTRGMPTIAYGDETELVGLRAKPTMTRGTPTMQTPLSDKAMIEQFTKLKAGDLAASQAAQETALHQAQQQEEMRNAQAVARWQKKEGETAKMLGLGPMLSMAVRTPTTASGAAPEMTRGMLATEYGADAELFGLRAKPSMTRGTPTMHSPTIA